MSATLRARSLLRALEIMSGAGHLLLLLAGRADCRRPIEAFLKTG